MSNGLIVYRGPSQLDGAPIIGIVTGFSEVTRNPKIGQMLQLWILRSDLSPSRAAALGKDVSICGDCKHRPVNQNTCYVRVIHAPRSVYDAFRRGAYADVAVMTGCTDYADADNLTMAGLLVAASGRPMRLGAYGDPAALPIDVVAALADAAPRHTGYTHQWAAFPELRRYVMASADSLAEMLTATTAGFRTFRTGADAHMAAPHEVMCPASEEAGKRTDCARCGLCNGVAGDRHAQIANIRIRPHGASAVKFYRSAEAVA